MLKLIGYWRDDRHPELPDPAHLVDGEWDEDERETVACYFDRGTIARACMGYSPCRLCGKNNGAVEYTDGHYIWPKGLAHYIRDHHVRPPAVLVRWALINTRMLDDAEIKADWWTTVTEREGA